MISSGLLGESTRAKFPECNMSPRQIRIESHAAEKTRSFYIHVFLPWAKKHKIATNPVLWYLAEKSDPSETLILHDVDKTGTYWLYYENGYDDIIGVGEGP